ncbi:MAG: hypothetical protein SLAVMIC_00279 [uncultured marine phage]|uniref:Uncharacterized protein n=1 Tax=uncultured marine phage TaxID=707152 RepID=A0A8D9CBB0_9VIRU|nr:MAG: hypothetical protein SLAVMIC_00279 [uncultured marine phage]
MIIPFKNLDSFDTEIMENAMRWQRNGVELKKVKGETPKYFLIDWRGVTPEDVKPFLDDVEDWDLSEYMWGGKTINNLDVLYYMYRKIETRNEEHLWNELVDCHHLSNELYMKNDYKENFSLFVKLIDFHLPLDENDTKRFEDIS